MAAAVHDHWNPAIATCCTAAAAVNSLFVRRCHEQQTHCVDSAPAAADTHVIGKLCAKTQMHDTAVTLWHPAKSCM